MLGLREYRAMFWAELFSFAGDQVAAVALAVLLYERSGSPFIAALGYASAFLSVGHRGSAAGGLRGPVPDPSGRGDL